MFLFVDSHRKGQFGTSLVLLLWELFTEFPAQSNIYVPSNVVRPMGNTFDMQVHSMVSIGFETVV